MVWEIFKNMQYDVYYKAIFVLFAFLTIISVLWEVKAVSNETLFYLGISSVVYSVVMWVLNDLARIWSAQLNELRGQMNINYLGDLKKVLALHIFGAFVWIAVLTSILFIN